MSIFAVVINSIFLINPRLRGGGGRGSPPIQFRLNDTNWMKRGRRGSLPKRNVNFQRENGHFQWEDFGGRGYGQSTIGILPAVHLDDWILRSVFLKTYSIFLCIFMKLSIEHFPTSDYFCSKLTFYTEISNYWSYCKFWFPLASFVPVLLQGVSASIIHQLDNHYKVLLTPFLFANFRRH